MDDFVTSNLYASRDEWTARLVTILTPHLIEGVKSIFNEAYNLCVTNDEIPKYLLCFQNLLCQVPKWNATIIEQERIRIIEKSGCNYLSDLLTCVHIIQLKILTCIRVGNKQKKIDISIPPLDNFLHKVYIHIARKVYMNVYLFEKNISPLLMQKNVRELEMMVQECILNTVRDSIPTESIIRAYMDESVELEEEVTVEPIPYEEPAATAATAAAEGGEDKDVPAPVKEEDIPKEEPPPSVVPSIKNVDDNVVTTRLTFNEFDKVVDEKGKIEDVSAPKTIERLEELSVAKAMRSIEDDFADSESDGKLTIHPTSAGGDLDGLIDLEVDSFDLDKPFVGASSSSAKKDEFDLEIDEFP